MSERSCSALNSGGRVYHADRDHLTRRPNATGDNDVVYDDRGEMIVNSIKDLGVYKMRVSNQLQIVSM